MLRNRHVITALLVAPILAVLAWFAVGNLVGERATPAQAGQSYPLVARSNCRYESGQCDLENEDLRLTLSFESSFGGALELRSSHALDSVLMAVADVSAEPNPRHMQPQDTDGRRWRLPLNARPGVNDRIRLVAEAGGARYFAEAQTLFLQSGI